MAVVENKNRPLGTAQLASHFQPDGSPGRSRLKKPRPGQPARACSFGPVGWDADARSLDHVWLPVRKRLLTTSSPRRGGYVSFQ